MAGQRLVGHWKRDRVPAVRSLLRPRPETDHVVPIERRPEEGRGHTDLAEVAIGLALGVEMGHLVFAHQGRHAVVAQRDTLAGVLERRPDHVTHAGGLRRVRHVLGLRELALGREVLPVIRDAEGAIRAGERPHEARLVVQIGGDDLRAARRERSALFVVRVTRQRADGEAALRIVEDGPRQSAALRARCSHNRDPLAHCSASGRNSDGTTRS